MKQLSSEWDKLTAWPMSIISMNRVELTFQSKRPMIDVSGDARAANYHPCISNAQAV